MGSLSNIDIALSLKEVLVENDLPHLFEAVDAVGTHYLCLLVNEENGHLEYAGMPVSRKKISRLKSGKIDLRSAFIHSEIGFWYLVQNFREEVAFAARMELPNLPEEWLPNQGFYLID